MDVATPYASVPSLLTDDFHNAGSAIVTPCTSVWMPVSGSCFLQLQKNETEIKQATLK